MNPMIQFKRISLLALLIVLAFLVIQLIPRALGQRDASKRSSDVEIPLPKQQSAPLEPAVCSSWTATSSLNTGRTYHTTLLLNGMVLVAGGPRVDLASADLVGACTPTPTATPTATPRVTPTPRPRPTSASRPTPSR